MNFVGRSTLSPCIVATCLLGYIGVLVVYRYGTEAVLFFVPPWVNPGGVVCGGADTSPAIRTLPRERQGRALRPQVEPQAAFRVPTRPAAATAPLAAALPASPFVFGLGWV